MPMIDERIIRQNEFPQVLFIGDHSIELKRHIMTYPSPHGDEYSDMRYGEPTMAGLSFKEIPLTSISNERIYTQGIDINGRKTLVVLAELHSVDKNKSLVDSLVIEKNSEIEELKMKIVSFEKNERMWKKFLDEHGIEEYWKDWAMNNVELVRVISTKLAGKQPEITPVSVDIGEKDRR